MKWETDQRFYLEKQCGIFVHAEMALGGGADSLMLQKLFGGGGKTAGHYPHGEQCIYAGWSQNGGVCRSRVARGQSEGSVMFC